MDTTDLRRLTLTATNTTISNNNRNTNSISDVTLVVDSNKLFKGVSYTFRIGTTTTTTTITIGY